MKINLFKKRTTFIMVAMLIFIGFSISGCIDPKPINWDINHEKWELWHTGTISKATVIPHIDYPKKQCIRIEFKDNTKFTIYRTRKVSTLIPGSTGKLYKYTYKGSDDHNSWFQWFPEKGQILKDAFTNRKVFSWQKYPNNRPTRYEVVLVKLENGTLALAYQNHINSWKLNFHKLEKDNRETIEEVVAWRKIDLN